MSLSVKAKAPPPSFLEEAASGVTVLLKSVRKNWPLVGATVLLGGASSLLYAKSQQKVYQAATMIEINPHVTQPLGDKSEGMLDLGTSLFSDPHEYFETQYKIITSDRVLSAVVRDGALAADNTFLGNSTAEASPTSVETAVSALRSRVVVDGLKRSHLAFIKVEDSDPRRAQRLADAVANAYIDQNLQAAISSSSDAVVWLNGQLDNVRATLDENENALHAFKEKNELPSTSLNEASNMLRIEMEEYSKELSHTRSRKQELLARHIELSKVSDDSPDDLPSSELLSNGFLQKLRQEYQEAVRLQMDLFAQGKGENHPLTKAADAKVAETKSALLAEVRNIKGAVRKDLAVIERQEAGAVGLFEGTRKRAVDLNMKEIEYHRLDRARDQNEKLYGFLLERVKQADLTRMMRVNNIRIVDVARAPTAPIRPRVSLTVGIGILLGLLFGVGLAWLRELLDNSLKTPDEVENFLRVSFLGLIPDLHVDDRAGSSRKSRRKSRRAPPSAMELVVHERPLSGVAEAARTIRTNLMFMNPDRPFKRLLVTSAAPSEGKTTVACSIAIALAQGGQRVCIVDCDLRRPRLHRIFGRAGEDGVTSVIVGASTIDDVAKPTDVPNLWSIPAGATPPNPADLLQSERFLRFLDELGKKFDRIVLDSPPIVAVTDAAIISKVVDGTVFVTRAFKTSRHLARQGLRALLDVNAQVLGVVLNAVNLNRHEYSYYYHYYYYKREGYGTRESAVSGASDEGERNASPPN
jgi:succinoglycan biosynthesis transport protein ExoP